MGTSGARTPCAPAHNSQTSLDTHVHIFTHREGKGKNIKAQIVPKKCPFRVLDFFFLMRQSNYSRTRDLFTREPEGEIQVKLLRAFLLVYSTMHRDIL